MSDASQFCTNRVLKDFKEKYNCKRPNKCEKQSMQILSFRDKVHADWVKAWLQMVAELLQYVKQHHTTGLTWNCAPVSAESELLSEQKWFP